MITLTNAEDFKPKNKNQLVYEFLKLNILNGNLKPNDRILPKDISKLINISGIPIREGIKKLEAEGLITISPNMGASVTSYDQNEIEEIHYIRTELEGLAAKLSQPFLKKKDFEMLEKILDECEKAIQSKNFERLSELNKQFHLQIYKCSPNKRLYKMVKVLWNQSRLVPSSLSISPKRAKQSYKEHLLILKALRDGNGELACEMIKKQKVAAMNTISKGKK